ncbi:cell attachment protein [melian virus]|uniref:Cell attachment protein n=1 Tax=melian virus TaxID=2940995 RepID=A0AAE9HQI4_9MONO|nr:cell attachment protein [melian virus]
MSGPAKQNNPKINTRETNVKKFYGVETAEKVADSISNNKLFILANTLLILTSTVIIITLNITNLEGIKHQNEVIRNLHDEIKSKIETINNLEQIIKGDLKPKISLINSAVSVSLPGQISNLQNKMLQKFKTLEDSVIDQCTCNPLSGIFPSKPPHTSKPDDEEDDNDFTDDDKVDDTIQGIDYPTFTTCNKSDHSMSITPGPNLYTVPSLTYREDNDDECVVNPSFSIGTSIYMYSQEIRKTDCKQGPLVGIKITLGRIVDKGLSGPQVSPLLVWDVPKPELTGSCAVAAGNEVGWVLCSTTLAASSGEPIPNMFEGFKLYKFEPEKEVVQYIITKRAFRLDNPYHTMNIGKGGGIIKEDGLYFQGFGVIYNSGKVDPLCDHGKCPGVGSYMPTCLSAMSMMGDVDFVVVDNIIKVVDYDIGKPVIDLKTFKISETYRGSNGRIYDMGSKFGLYLASSSWNRFLKFGTSNDMNPDSFKWANFKTPIMNVQTSCRNTNENMCPQVCYGTGYEDIFPLNDDGSSRTYTTITTNGSRTQVYIRARVNGNNVGSIQVLNDYYFVYSATTSCFMFKNEGWCIVINEAKLNKNDKQRIYAHSYRLKRLCMSGMRSINSTTGLTTVVLPSNRRTR